MLSIVVTYYNQPAMLAEQARIWQTYRAAPEIIVVDDGSKVPAAAQTRSCGYRVHQDIPWHQDGARNLGAFVATGEWLLFLDIDHAICAEELASLQRALPNLADDTAFRPARRLVDDAYPLKAAANIWLIRRADYWRVGGYDERLCGSYGTDQEFIPRLRRTLAVQDLPITLDVYRRKDIADAATGGLDRTVVVPPRLKGARKVLGFEWSRAW